MATVYQVLCCPQEEDDIQMVYDATTNRLNEVMWVPTFWLPTINLLVLVRNVGHDLWMTDRVVSDMFLDYLLHKDVCPYTSIDLLCLYEGPKKAGPRWAVWDRNLMGFAVSPYNSIKMALMSKEVCKGNHFETGVGYEGKELNPFQWKCIKLNLPGTKDYNPCVS
jgi:hypothetical protein